MTSISQRGFAKLTLVIILGTTVLGGGFIVMRKNFRAPRWIFPVENPAPQTPQPVTFPAPPPSPPPSPPPAPAPQPTGLAPQGIFVTSNSNTLVQSLIKKPYVDGILIRAHWSTVQPSEGVFDWSSVDYRIGLAQAQGKKVSIAVFPGNKGATPSWIYDKGVKKWESSISGTMPDPMSPLFYELWYKVVREFGARYSNNPIVSHTVVCGSTGLLCGLRFADLPSNFNKDTLVQRWKETVDLYAEVFPNKLIGFEIHNTKGYGADLAESVLEHAYGKYGSKFGVFEEFLSDTAPTGNLAQPVLDWGPKSGKTWCGFQAVSVLAGKLDGAYRHGYEDFGCKYIEIYGTDLNDPKYESVHEKWHETIWK